MNSKQTLSLFLLALSAAAQSFPPPSTGGGEGTDVSNITTVFSAANSTASIPWKVVLSSALPGSCATGEAVRTEDILDGTDEYRCIDGAWKQVKFIGGDNGAISVVYATGSTLPKISLVDGYVGWLAQPNAWSARNDYTGAFKPPSGTSAPAAGACNESSEYDDVYVYRSGSAGQKLYICTAAGWEAQGPTPPAEFDPFDASILRLVDEFPGGSNTAGVNGFGQLGWKTSVSGTAGGSDGTTPTGAWAEGTGVSLAASGINGRASLSLSASRVSIKDLSTHAGWRAQFIFGTDEFFTVQYGFRVGFSDVLTTTPANFIGLRAISNNACTETASDTAWQWEVRTAGTPVLTATATAFALSNIMTVEFESSVAGTINARYRVNGGSWSTPVPLSSLPTGSMYFLWQTYSCDAGSHTMKLLRFAFEATGISYR